MVYFLDENHSYFDDSSVKWNSNSKFIGQYCPPFDEEFISMRSAYKKNYPKIYKKAKSLFKWYDPKIVDWMFAHTGPSEAANVYRYAWEEIQDWDEKKELGTEYHDYEEMLATKRGYVINHFDKLEYETIPRPKKEGQYDNKYILNDVVKLSLIHI